MFVLRKKILAENNTFAYAKDFMHIFNFCLIDRKDIKLAIEIKEKYKFSYWDSLIVASALENNCSILYTEDMQDGQIIEKKLEIVNPFRDI
ncbi:PIN domain-containing protein [Desulfonauticus submarinus]